ncbi:hypothetical protein NLJ89_g3749 [Agrocybe chaxingu]|uniref:Glycosyltransferase family 31 protein n=1 Tax=Agrocybe chaxingu TaxID=84603 RepID=A0A9W8MY60_9AGAR|nr:hypothetical protein NLJ89_g3749 [Agrocybe chaxingu]
MFNIVDLGLSPPPPSPPHCEVAPKHEKKNPVHVDDDPPKLPLPSRQGCGLGHDDNNSGGRYLRVLKRWLRRLVLSLILLSVFAISLTLLLIYVLNPDKDPLPWRAYCSIPSLAPPFDRPAPPNTPHFYPNFTDGHILPEFPPSHFDDLPPAGVLVGVFSIDSGFERRMLIRTTWASHPRSRDGAGAGDDGLGTSRTLVRFVMGQPRKDWERRVKLEMEMYNDIVILPIPENMNGGKTHTFFSWAAINAWVPPVYRSSVVPVPTFSYSNSTSTPPSLAPHDPFLAWSDITSGRSRPWVRPDFVIKVDDDSFLILAELEARLRVELHSNPQKNGNAVTYRDDGEAFSPSSGAAVPIARSPLTSAAAASLADPALRDPLIYWGYLVTNRLHIFMAGELYALSWSLVDWVSKDPTVKTLTRGAEDKQTAKWMRSHPRTVYSHGFLFPSEASRVRRSMIEEHERTKKAQETLGGSGGVTSPTSVGAGGTPAAWAHSSVSTFGVRYTPPLPDLSSTQSVEALVEGSDMSQIREGAFFPQRISLNPAHEPFPILQAAP